MSNQERAYQRHLRRQARRGFDARKLKWFCTAAEEEFASLGQLTSLGYRKHWRLIGGKIRPARQERFYVHRDNGSDILGVAHLDSVQGQRWCHLHNTVAGPVVASPTLDDRLGAYVICSLLPACGLKADWLLTVGEESCDSTAQEFETDKEYNWIFSFDRRGTDVVMYHYETSENRQRIASVGATVSDGSYSDICELEHLGVAGFNFGVGYRDYHDTRAWAPLNDTFLQAGRFLSFHQKYGSERIEHVASQPEPWWWNDKGWPSESEDNEECPECGAWALVRLTNGYFCDNCGRWMGPIRTDTHSLTDSEWQHLEEMA